MSMIPQLSQFRPKPNDKEVTDWKLCIDLCQSDYRNREPLVSQPKLDSYQKLLDTVHERASLNDGSYVEVHRRLKNVRKEALCEENAIWHRSCYCGATNKDQIQRTRDRHEHALSTGSYPTKKRGRKRGSNEMDQTGVSTSGRSAPFTRSSTAPLENDLCFFLSKG